MMIPWAERSPEVCLMAKTLYPDIVKNHPEFVPESVHNQDSIYTLNSLMESLTGEKFSYRQMTDFYNAGRRAEGQVGEVRQGDGRLLLLRHPAGAKTGSEDVA